MVEMMRSPTAPVAPTTVEPKPVWAKPPLRMKSSLMDNAAELLIITDPKLEVITAGELVAAFPRLTVPMGLKVEIVRQST